MGAHLRDPNQVKLWKHTRGFVLQRDGYERTITAVQLSFGNRNGTLQVAHS